MINVVKRAITNLSKQEKDDSAGKKENKFNVAVLTAVFKTSCSLIYEAKNTNRKTKLQEKWRIKVREI